MNTQNKTIQADTINGSLIQGEADEGSVFYTQDDFLKALKNLDDDEKIHTNFTNDFVKKVKKAGYDIK